MNLRNREKALFLISGGKREEEERELLILMLYKQMQKRNPITIN